MVKAIDTTNGSIRFEVLAFEQSYRGGVHLATGNIDGDGFDDVIVGSGRGHRPEVKVFSGFDGALVATHLHASAGVAWALAASALNTTKLFAGIAHIHTAASVPKYAAMTFGLARTSAGVPSAILRP